MLTLQLLLKIQFFIDQILLYLLSNFSHLLVKFPLSVENGSSNSIFDDQIRSVGQYLAVSWSKSPLLLVKFPWSAGKVPCLSSCMSRSIFACIFLREKHHYLLLKPLSVGKNIDLWNSHDLLVNIPTVGDFSKSLHSVRAFPGRGFSHYIYGNWTIHRWCSMIFPAQKPFI